MYIKKEIHEGVLKSSQLEKNDLLIAIVGATIGQVSIFNYDVEANINQALALVRFKKLDALFVKNFLLTKIGQKELDRLKRPVARANINLEEIGTLKIPIPPKEIQQKIISIMDSAYSLKKENEEQAKNLIESIDGFVLEKLEIKMPELKEEMTFLVSSKDLENNRIDAEFHQEKYKQMEKALENGKYELKNIEEVIEYIKKGVEVGSNEYLEEGKKFLRVADFDNFEIYEKKIKFISNEIFNQNRMYQPKKNEILFSKDGTIGLCKVLENNFEGIISSGIIRIKTKENIDDYFLSYVLRNKFIKLLFENLSIGQIIKHLNIDEIKNLKIPVPPLAMQQEIATKVTQRLDQAKQLKQTAAELLDQAKKEVESILLAS